MRTARKLLLDTYGTQALLTRIVNAAIVCILLIL